MLMLRQSLLIDSVRLTGLAYVDKNESPHTCCLRLQEEFEMDEIREYVEAVSENEE